METPVRAERGVRVLMGELERNSLEEGVPEWRRRTDGRFGGYLHPQLDAVPLAELFEHGRSLGNSGGRGEVRVLTLETAEGRREVVARDYRRGGLMRHVSESSFRTPDRAIWEVDQTTVFRSMGVPTLTPLGAVWRRGRLGGYRLRLLTILETEVESLSAAFAHAEDFDPEQDRQRGEVVLALAAARSLRGAFEGGLLHSDLHPENLLVRRTDQGVEVLVIDLDGCEWAPNGVSTKARDSMLVRAARYCVKHRERLGKAPSPKLVEVLLAAIDPSENVVRWGERLVSELTSQCRRRRERFGLSDSDLERIESYPRREA